MQAQPQVNTIIDPKLVELIQRAPAIKAMIEAEESAEATRRESLFAERERLGREHEVTMKPLRARLAQRREALERAQREFNEAANALRAVEQAISDHESALNSRLNRVAGELDSLGNGDVDAFIREYRLELLQERARRDWRETRTALVAGGDEVVVVERTDTAVFDRLKALQAALVEAEGMLAKPIAPAAIRARLAELREACKPRRDWARPSGNRVVVPTSAAA